MRGNVFFFFWRWRLMGTLQDITPLTIADIRKQMKVGKWNSRLCFILWTYFALFSIVLQLTSHTIETRQSETTQQQGRSRNPYHFVWQFNRVVQEGYEYRRCDGCALVALNTENAVKTPWKRNMKRNIALKARISTVFDFYHWYFIIVLRSIYDAFYRFNQCSYSSIQRLLQLWFISLVKN